MDFKSKKHQPLGNLGTEARLGARTIKPIPNLQIERAGVFDNPNFRRRFGQSKIVDGCGLPLVVYHGTTKEFNVFSTEHIGEGADSLSNLGDYGDGFYFTTVHKDAVGYAGGGPGAKVMELFLAIQNPVSAQDLMNIEGVDALLQDPYPGETLSRLLESMGYDGIIVNGGQEIVAFRPEQIKSATANSGAFDPNNPEITR